jgi:hypothetical protein
VPAAPRWPDMDTVNNNHHAGSEHTTAAEVGEEVLTVTGSGLRVVELAAATLLGLLICPPLLILAVVASVSAVAVFALVAAVVAATAVPTILVRHVRAHHRTYGSTLFLHHLRR